MYTLLIVDDEPLSQVGLRSMIDWGSLDVAVVGASPNGLHALEEIRRLRPDIVIADLRMPLLDGIGLIERCREELGDGGPAFIVLSGYADFDAARRALRGEAVDYLVKLELDEATLRASVERAKAAALARRRSGLSPAAGIGRRPEGGSGGFAEAALARLLAGGYPSQAEARAALEAAGLPAGEGLRCVAYLEARYSSGDRLSEDERLRAYCCAVDMLKEVAGRELEILVAPFDLYSLAALLRLPERGSPGGEAEEGERLAVAALSRATEMAEKLFGVELRGGLGAASRDLGAAASSYREAKRAAGAAGGGEGGRRLVRFLDLPPPPREERGARRAALVAAVAERSAAGIRAAFGEAAAELASADLPPSGQLALCCELLYPVLERLEDGEAVLDSIFPEGGEGWRRLFSARRPEDFAAWLERAGEGLAARFESSESRGRNPLVAGVRKYVIENSSARLSLTEVARRFGVSPNHLSSIFKKYAGVGFAEFVARMRIERAKELIAEGRYKMFEVAQLVGFEDAFYFSKVFKRVTGTSPRDYYLSRGERGPSSGPGAEAKDIFS